MAKITAVHAVLYSKNASAVRKFFRSTLGFSCVDAGDGWLIFALPPAELGIHPTNKTSRCDLYLMCDDIQATVKALKRKGVRLAQPITDVGWGILTSLKLPDGGQLGLYEPRHPTALKRTRTAKRRTQG